MITNIKATNAIFLGDKQENEEQRPFKARFLQAGLVKYDFGVCLLKKKIIDRFINTFIDCPVIIDHKDNLTEDDRKGTIKNIWFSPEDGWFWCDGVLSDEAANLVEQGYNVSCQYRITEYTNNFEHKLHNGNEYDKEILNGIFEHLAIVKTPRYEDAYIAVNAICKNEAKEEKVEDWITVKGNHIPIKEGETKKEAVKKKVEEWQEHTMIIKEQDDEEQKEDIEKEKKVKKDKQKRDKEKNKKEEETTFRPDKFVKGIVDDYEYLDKIMKKNQATNSFTADFADYAYNMLSEGVNELLASNKWVTLKDKKGEPYHVEFDDKEEKKENRTKNR